MFDKLVPELVLEIDDLPLLGLVLSDEVFQFSLDLSSLSLLTGNLFLSFIEGAFQSLQTVVDLRRKNIKYNFILDLEASLRGHPLMTSGKFGNFLTLLLA